MSEPGRAGGVSPPVGASTGGVASPTRLEAGLLAEARRLGFALAGIAAATRADGFERLRDWLDRGHAGEMGYLHAHAAAREHPRGVFPEVRSVVMVGMDYGGPAARGSAKVARYARGADYHKVVRERLRRLGAWLRERRPGCWGRVAVDTAPLLERDFARRAGLGWFGKNTMLIHPRHGSWFVLGGLLVDVELEPTPSFDTAHCGTCTACLDACPTQAFVAPLVLDARRCVSYLTIELRREVPEDLRAGLGDWVYGCDVCQEVCPWNRKAPAGHPALAARPDLVAVDAAELLGLSAEAFRERFEGTALYPRPGRPVVLRNAALVLGNAGDAAALPALRRALDDPEPLVRDAAAWAIGRVERRGR
ncbi:MAG: tRNA epoxyqueuosine(34) reductase QueG [Gemmataceae bacterium]